MAKPAVFLDCDSVLNIGASHINPPQDLDLSPGTAAAVRSLNEQGIFCCLLSHQAESVQDDGEALPIRLCDLLEQEADAHFDARYHCPYPSPASTQWGTWRKPNTGMLVAAAWDHDLDLRHSFILSDKVSDIHLAHNAGLRGVLIQVNSGKKVLDNKYQHHAKPDYVADSLLAGVAWILTQLSEEPSS